MAASTGCPGSLTCRRASRRWRGKADPQRAASASDTPSSGRRSAGSRMASLRKTSFPTGPGRTGRTGVRRGRVWPGTPNPPPQHLDGRTKTSWLETTTQPLSLPSLRSGCPTLLDPTFYSPMKHLWLTPGGITVLHHQFKQAGKILQPNEERWMTPQSSSTPCRSPGRGTPIYPRAGQTPLKQEQ